VETVSSLAQLTIALDQLAQLISSAPSGLLEFALLAPREPSSEAESVLLLTHFARPSTMQTVPVPHATVDTTLMLDNASDPQLFQMETQSQLMPSVPSGPMVSVSNAPDQPTSEMEFALNLTHSARPSTSQMETACHAMLVTSSTVETVLELQTAKLKAHLICSVPSGMETSVSHAPPLPTSRTEFALPPTHCARPSIAATETA